MITVIDRTLMSGLMEAARQSPRRRVHRNFHPGNDYPAHRLLIAMEPDSYVPPHRHLSSAKDETLLILRGSLGVIFFDAGGRPECGFVLQAGGERLGVDIPHGVFHTVIALEPGCLFFEAKAGPYVPVSAEERAAWAPLEGESGAPAFLAELRAYCGAIGGAGLSD